MTQVPRVIAAIFAGVMSVVVLWLHRTTVGLIASCVLVAATLYLAVPADFDGFRKELSDAWASYKNPQKPAP